MSRRYRLFGLTIESELELPEVAACEGEGEADVVIRMAALDAALPQADGLQGLGPADDLFGIPEVARYRCRNGTEITVEACPGVPARNVRLYLLGSVMGLLLHQRGLLPLHGNAIIIDGGAVVFMGPSGVGKSTLAAWFHDCGHAVLADDVALVRFDGSQALVEPGLSRVRLWRDAVEASGRRAEHFPRSYAGDEQWDKFDIPLKAVAHAAVPLSTVVLLGESAEPVITPLTGVAAVEALMSNIYRGGYIDSGASLEKNFTACLKLTQSIPIRSWSRPRIREAMEQQGAELLERLRLDRVASYGTRGSVGLS